MTRLISISDVDAWLALGHSYPKTTLQFRSLFRARDRNGLRHAFVRVGGRICVDEEKFIEAVRRLNDAVA